MPLDRKWPLKGGSCDYSDFGVDLKDGASRMGLPNFLPFYFYKPQILIDGNCLGDTTKFVFSQYQNSDSLSWDFGDGSPVVTTKPIMEIKHTYTNSSTYSVKLFVHHCGITDTVRQIISINKPPTVNLGSDFTICNSCSITLDGGEGMEYWIW